MEECKLDINKGKDAEILYEEYEYHEIKEMSFSSCARTSPELLKKFGCDAHVITSVEGAPKKENKKFWEFFKGSNKIKNFFTMFTCCFANDEEEIWGEETNESVVYKEYTYNSRWKIEIPSYPVREIPYVVADTPYNKLLCPLSSLEWVSKLILMDNANSIGMKNNRYSTNPFIYGMCYIIRNNANRILLESCYCENSTGMSTCPRILEFMPYEPLLKYNSYRLLSTYENSYKELSEMLTNNNAPLEVLIHHVMLYHYYPSFLQSALWTAVSSYLEERCNNGLYSKLLVKAAKQHFGDIRLYFVTPDDIYTFDHCNNWIAIVTRNFMAYIETKRKLEFDSIPFNCPLITQLFPLISSPKEMAWLLLIVCTDSNESWFPVHAYINTKTRILRPRSPKLDFFLKESDLLYFQDKQSISEFDIIRKDLLEDLIQCDSYVNTREQLRRRRETLNRKRITIAKLQNNHSQITFPYKRHNIHKSVDSIQFCKPASNLLTLKDNSYTQIPLEPLLLAEISV